MAEKYIGQMMFSKPGVLGGAKGITSGFGNRPLTKLTGMEVLGFSLAAGISHQKQELRGDPTVNIRN